MRMVIAPVQNQQAKELLPLVVTRIGIRYPQEPVQRICGAGIHHIFYIEEGEGIIETAGGSFPLTEGTVLFMHAGLPVHYYGTTECFESSWVTFMGQNLAQILQYLGAEDFALFQDRSFGSMLRECFHLAENGADQAELSGNVYSMLISFFKSYHNSKKIPALLQARQYAEEHYMENLSVRDMAKAAGISESLLFKLFREKEQTSPTGYLRQVRLRRACQMLLSEPKSKVSEIAACCGFTDAAYFCKIFHMGLGMTPKKYRDKYGWDQ